MSRTIIFAAIAALALPAAAVEYDWTLGVGQYEPVPEDERLVGIAYTTWHRSALWNSYWDTPELGKYESDDVDVIRQHAAWLAGANVDFIWIDWSNNVNYDPETMHDSRPDFAMIEDSTTLIFEEYYKLAQQGKPHPKISIFTGCPSEPEALTDGRLRKKLDQIYDDYVSNPNYRPLIQDYLGKPLMVVYLGTPTPFQQDVPDFDDARFTIRFMTGFITEQGNLVEDDLESAHGYWSWEDRGPQTYAVHDGQPEAMVVVASWRKQGEPGEPNYIPARGREGGETFRQEWARARAIGPKFAMVVSWNEWVTGEQPSVEVSKDIEPSEAYGHQYLDLLKEEAARFKGEADGDQAAVQCPHDADVNGDFDIGLSELLRMIQFYNAAGYTCDAETEDGFDVLLAGG